MTSSATMSRSQLAIAMAFFTGAIFITDLSVPLGVAGGVPYVAVVLLALWSPHEQDVLLTSLGAIGLTLVGWGVSPEPAAGTPVWAVASNRAIAVFAIAACGGGCYVWQRTRAEFAIVREELFESERRRQENESLARLGKMSALIAHEVKNPLAGMRAALQVLGRGMPAASPERQIMTEICGRVDALHVTLENMLVYGRPDAARTEDVSVRAIIASAIAQFREVPAHQSVVVEVSHDTNITVVADPRRCTAALYNLLLNASQAMEHQGQIRIQTSLYSGWCRLVMEDNGPGIPPDLLPKIFDPFVTTKARGSGLGLAIVQQTLDQHNGTVSVSSELGVGTRVTLSLPVVDLENLTEHKELILSDL